ncbi:hypothetical protein [Deinococcus sp. JMULE3]|uniref:N-acyl amino acid synthase FeeM domain-containing protein n=1 Tax=Deinococcus sp. JMULE3 TaxID=2518341 RepID=UPI00157720F8|nr:hypothetical protein [Deinococcus sp. JMULE3]NTY02432.1 hypothetical protein [Deinococcus sp. JMULE3]
MSLPGHQFSLSRVRTSGEWDIVARMRYRAYRSVQAIPEKADARFTDAFDEQPQAMTVLAHLGEVPVASTRTLCARGDLGGLTSSVAFHDVMRTIPADAVVVEANRFVADPVQAHLGGGAVWALFRAHLLRCAAVKADFFVAGVRAEHVALYRRLMHLEVVSEARIFPGLRTPMVLMVGDCRRDLERIFLERPHLRPAQVEAERLFGEVSRVYPDHQYARPGL